MPLLVRAPGCADPGRTETRLVTNIDLAPTLLQLAGAEVPAHMQGHGMLDLIQGRPPTVAQDCVYYRYWEHDSAPHHVPAHLGLRTDQHKLIGYLDASSAQQAGPTALEAVREWELYDLVADPHEMINLAADPGSAQLLAALQQRLRRKQRDVGDTRAAGTTA